MVQVKFEVIIKILFSSLETIFSENVMRQRFLGVGIFNRPVYRISFSVFSLPPLRYLFCPVFQRLSYDLPTIWVISFDGTSVRMILPYLFLFATLFKLWIHINELNTTVLVPQIHT